MQQIDKTSPQSFGGLEKTDIERLRADAVARYESVMARELIRFEAEIEKTSNDLLENLQAHTNKPDEKLMTVMNHMIQSTEAGYQTALDKLITNFSEQLKTMEADIVKRGRAAEQVSAQIIEDRKAAALKHIEGDLADIFNRYFTQVVSEIDLSDQQDLILAKLEAMKPQLLEDIKRVG